MTFTHPVRGHRRHRYSPPRSASRSRPRRRRRRLPASVTSPSRPPGRRVSARPRAVARRLHGHHHNVTEAIVHDRPVPSEIAPRFEGAFRWRWSTGCARMAEGRAAGLEIPPGESVRAGAGSYHVMFMNLRHPRHHERARQRTLVFTMPGAGGNHLLLVARWARRAAGAHGAWPGTYPAA